MPPLFALCVPHENNVDKAVSHLDVIYLIIVITIDITTVYGRMGKQPHPHVSHCFVARAGLKREWRTVNTNNLNNCLHQRRKWKKE